MNGQNYTILKLFLYRNENVEVGKCRMSNPLTQYI